MSLTRPLAVLVLAAVALAGCEKNPLLVKRSACPAVAVPTYAGDVTLFNPPLSRDASAVDVVATITNVRENCIENASTYASDISYDVLARRTSSVGARTVSLPVFASVVQGGNLIVSKQISQVSVTFADGQLRATGHSGARANISRAAAAVPPAIQDRISRVRKAGDLDAAIDPLADPTVKAAVRAATFEVLVGFQLDDAALAYNVTK